MKSPLVGLVLAATVGVLPVAPPEHVHETEDHGHSHALVHRHLALHMGVYGADNHGALDDHDAPALTLRADYTVPAFAAALGQPPSVVVATLQPPDGETVHRTRQYVERLIHGPPRPRGPSRAPPHTSRL